MADPIVLVSLALFGSAALALSPVPTAIAAASIAAVLRDRAGRSAIAIALGALLLGGLRARAALERASAIHRRATELFTAPARCEGEGRVVGSPVVMRGPNGAAPAAGEPLSDARVEIAIEAGSCGGRPIGAPLRA